MLSPPPPACPLSRGVRKPPGLPRRAALAASGAALLASSGCHVTGGERPPATTSPGHSQGPFAALDVHSHVFNAKDLPIGGFLRYVYVPEALEHAALTNDLTGALTLLLAEMLQANVLTPAEELEAMRRPDRRRFFAARVAETSDLDVLVEQALMQALPRYLGIPAASGLFNEHFAALGISSEGPSREERMRLLEKLTDKPQEALVVRPESSRFGFRLSLSDVRRIAKDIMNGPRQVYGVLRMGALLRLSRRELVRRLAELPNGNAGEVRFLAPAVIDYTMWLRNDRFDDHSISPVVDQVDVMSAISATPGRRFALHPYVPFCPWRQVQDSQRGRADLARGKTAMDVVRYAIEQKGFVGVKVYPVLGFRPYNNARHWNEAYPARLRELDPTGAELDRALAGLYDWCVCNDVPILTHTSFSQNPTEGAGMRGAPELWREVLEARGGRWRTLRLNLGHLGGLWDLAKGDAQRWPDQAIALMSDGSFPNVYGDISDYDWVVRRTSYDGERDDEVMKKLRAILNHNQNSRRALDRMMYGTDWVMLSKSDAAPDYYVAMRDRIHVNLGMTETQRRGFLGANAADFLGISAIGGRKPATRQRLERFHAQHGLDLSVLSLWDRPDAAQLQDQDLPAFCAAEAR